MAAEAQTAVLNSEGSLRRAIMESQQESAGTSIAGDARNAISCRGGRHSAWSELLGQAEMHRPFREPVGRSSARSVRAMPVRRAEPPAEASDILRRIIAEEEAAVRAVGEAAQASAQEASHRIGELETLEFLLFGLVLIALMLEGLFVISPAVVRIQQFMDDLRRSHEELKAYASKLERSNTRASGLRFGGLARSAGAAAEGPGVQRPAAGRRYAAALDDQGDDYLDRIQNAAGRMQTLINDLLTYSRVATKAKPFVPTDLVSVTREVVSDLEARIEQVDGRVEVGELPTVDADPLQVRQLMQNLIGNSLKYRRPDVPPVVRVSSRTLREDAAADRRRSRPVPFARSWSRTTGSASTRSTPSGSSRSSSGCMAAMNTRERASAWPSAARSSNGTAARSRRRSTPGEGSDIPCHVAGPSNQRRQVDDGSESKNDLDPDRR